MEKKSLQSVLNSGTKKDKPGCSVTYQHEHHRDGTGRLPANAPLANPYVPFQNNHPERYEAGKALIRGTLFPGLDLPYLGMVNNTEKGDTGLAELQALAFAMNELGLYLNTHKDDADAAALFRSYSELYRKGVEAYQKECRPLYQMFAVPDDQYLWTKGPWPWEYAANQCRED